LSTQYREPGVLQAIAGRKILFFAVFSLFVATISIVSLRMEPVYEATNVLLLETKRPQDKMSSFLSTQNPFFGRTEIQNEIQILNSLSLHRQVARRMLADDVPPALLLEAKAEGANLESWMLKRMRVKGIDGSDVVKIKFRARHPGEAARYANAVADVYVDMSRSRAREEIRQVKEFLAEQVDLLQGRLTSAEDRLLHYQEENHVTSLSDETKVLVEQLAEFEGAYHEAGADLEARRGQLEILKEQLDQARAGLEGDVPAVTAPLIGELRSQLAELMAYQAKYLSQGYDRSHQKMRELEHRVGEIKLLLSDATKSLLDSDRLVTNPLARVETLLDQILIEEVALYSLEARYRTLEAVVQNYGDRLEALPEKSYQLNQLVRNSMADEKLLAMLVERYEEARIVEAGLFGSARVIDGAVIPTDPIRPNHPLNLLFGCVFGLAIAGAACVVAQRSRRHRARR